ncbi:MAG: hypothetical protein SGILL_008151 [Bacillariaceae sp.]
MSARYSDSAQDQSEYDEETYEGQGETYRDGESTVGGDTEGDAPYAEDTGSQASDDEDGSEDGSGSDEEREEGSDEGSYDDEYDEEAYAEDHYTEKDEYEEEGRSVGWLWCLCCCCLFWIILAILLGILLPRKKNGEIVPTMAPTFFGGNGNNGPTGPPVSDAVPPQVSGQPNGDTTIYKDGPLRTEPQGEENVMLVQNDNFDDPEFPDTYALMNWYWDEAGYPWFNEDDLAGYEGTGLLCMEHIPNTNAGNEDATIYSICRLPSTFSGEDLETAGSTGFNYIMPTDCMGRETVDFDVRPNDETVCADVTPLIDAYPPFVSSQAAGSSRGLQENNFQNMLLMLQSKNDNTRSSDEFYTRQSGPRSPTLKLTMNPRGSGGNSGNSGNNGGGNNSNPTNAPFVPGGGQDEDVPTMSPTVSAAPSISAAPVGSDLYEPCGVCGREAFDGQLSQTFPISVPANIAPEEVEGSATCAELEDLCLSGKCKPQVCAGFVVVREDCGCYATSDNNQGGPTFCGICPAGTAVTRPDENIKDLISEFVDEELLASAGEEVTCSNIETLCNEGYCSAGECLSIPDILEEACGCEATAAPVFAPLPTNPTEAPTVSPAPSISPAPTYKAVEVPCGICGIGPTPNPLAENVPITVPNHLAPPQIKEEDGSASEASCAELEGYCQGGYCKRLTCRVLTPIRGICGCPNPYEFCSICGPGQTISNTNPTLNLDAALAIPGYDSSMTCGDMARLCDLGFCSPDQCSALVGPAAETCGCEDSVPDFTTSVTTDTTVYGDGPLIGDTFGTEDTMLVQRGAGTDELPSAYSLLQFTITDTEYEAIKRLGFGDNELCLTHVPEASEKPEMVYRACIVNDVEGNDVGPVNGEMVNYSIPASCKGNDEPATFRVEPTTGRICTMVTKMFKNNVKGPGIVTFMVDSPEENDGSLPGDRFYTSEDGSGRGPTFQIVDRPFE